MKGKTLFLYALLVIAILCVSSVGLANIWMDEDFDGTSIFVQGDGQGDTVSPANATLDIYSNAQPMTTLTGSVLSQTGAKVTSKFFDGSACYQIETGEVLGITGLVQDPKNGAFQIMQFGVNVDPIPAAGTVGEFRYRWDINSLVSPDVTYSFYVKLVSTGSAVNILAGEDVANSPASEATIGTLNSASDWKFITMVMQSNNGTATYPAVNLPPDHTLANIPEGVQFYCSSKTVGHFVAMAGNGGDKTFRTWDISATGGTIYVDTVYWEGGMDNTGSIDDVDEAKIDIKAFDYAGTGSAVKNWSLY